MAVAAILVIAIGFAAQMLMQKPPQTAQQKTGQANVGGPFTLVNTAGETVTEADFLGKPLLIYFGYTFCPDICPYSLQVMATALDSLGADKTKFTPIFITVDPERDTVASLAAYVASPSFPDGLVGLTGTAEQITAAAAAYAVYAKKAGEGDDYLMDHTSAIFLMDEGGDYAAVFTHLSSADDIAKCLRRHLNKKRC